jgi:opacity protein-like surface antigen
VNGEEKDYDNIFGLKFGVQHKLASNLFARFGYAYKRHYSQNVAIGLFTFGVGWEYFKTNFDLGIGIENLNFKKDETFYNELTTKFKLSVRRSL